VERGKRCIRNANFELRILKLHKGSGDTVSRSSQKIEGKTELKKMTGQDKFKGQNTNQKNQEFIY
jgi:hypothetical protein